MQFCGWPKGSLVLGSEHPAPQAAEKRQDIPLRPGISRSIPGRGSGWCPWPDSNQHGFLHSILSRARLPISPQGHAVGRLAQAAAKGNAPCTGNAPSQSCWTWGALGRMGLACDLPANPLAVPARPSAAHPVPRRPRAEARVRPAARPGPAQTAPVMIGQIGHSGIALIPIGSAPIVALVTARPAPAVAARPRPCCRARRAMMIAAGHRAAKTERLKERAAKTERTIDRAALTVRSNRHAAKTVTSALPAPAARTATQRAPTPAPAIAPRRLAARPAAMMMPPGPPVRRAAAPLRRGSAARRISQPNAGHGCARPFWKPRSRRSGWPRRWRGPVLAPAAISNAWSPKAASPSMARC